MSLLSTLLGRRAVESSPTGPEVAPSTLADLVAGTVARVVGISDAAGGAPARRLFDLGFVPGTHVEMLRRAPLGDPTVFRVAGYEIALRRVHARCVQVVPQIDAAP